MAKAIHSMIRVLEEQRSVDFYERAFGLEVADRFDFEGFTLIYLRNAEADFGSVQLPIVSGAWPEPPRKLTRTGRAALLGAIVAL